jgi:hypothetical protein
VVTADTGEGRPCTIVNDFFGLINDDEYSDVVFVFESGVDGRGRGVEGKEREHRLQKRDSRERREIRAHRNILYARCEQLKEMIEGPTTTTMATSARSDNESESKKTKSKTMKKNKKKGKKKVKQEEEEVDDRDEGKAAAAKLRLRRVKIRGIEYEVFYQLVVYLYTSELRLRDPPDEHVRRSSINQPSPHELSVCCVLCAVCGVCRVVSCRTTEMAYAGNCGISVTFNSGQYAGEELAMTIVRTLFAEELGLVLEVRADHADEVVSFLHGQGLRHAITLGTTTRDDRIKLTSNGHLIIDQPMTQLRCALTPARPHFNGLADVGCALACKECVGGDVVPAGQAPGQPQVRRGGTDRPRFPSGTTSPPPLIPLSCLPAPSA